MPPFCTEPYHAVILSVTSFPSSLSSQYSIILSVLWGSVFNVTVYTIYTQYSGRWPTVDNIWLRILQ